VTQLYAQPGSKPTPRELEIARTVLETDSMRDAAATLGINERSVRAHLANLRVRLRARHNEQLFYRLRDHMAA
jgi:DNA-binding CsgD family transcriptional regulator